MVIKCDRHDDMQRNVTENSGGNDEHDFVLEKAVEAGRIDRHECFNAPFPLSPPLLATASMSGSKRRCTIQFVAKKVFRGARKAKHESPRPEGMYGSTYLILSTILVQTQTSTLLYLLAGIRSTVVLYATYYGPKGMTLFASREDPRRREFTMGCICSCRASSQHGACLGETLYRDRRAVRF